MSTLSNSQRLRSTLMLVFGELNATAATLLNHPRLADFYAEYLFMLHAMIRASVPLMQVAHDQAKNLAETDPVAAGFVDYLAHHIPEEMHHDEWLLADMEILGLSRAEVLARMPATIVAEVVGAQYYWIFHHHPIALLGYIAVLEGYPTAPEVIDDMQQRTGYPREVFRTLLKHSRLDVYHRDDLNNAIDALPLTPEQRTIISVSAIQTIQLVTIMLKELLEKYELVAALP